MSGGPPIPTCQADAYTKGLNRKGGANVFRFENFKERVAMVDVNDAHKIKADSELEALPSGGLSGSFFKDELYRYIELDISKPFLTCHRTIAPMAQTMAQVLHHRKDIVDVLVTTIADPTSKLCWRSVLALIAALAKYVACVPLRAATCSRSSHWNGGCACGVGTALPFASPGTYKRSWPPTSRGF